VTAKQLTHQRALLGSALASRSSIKMNVLCQSTQSACDKMVTDFTTMNEQLRDSIKSQ
jgi:hypothetical protein